MTASAVPTAPVQEPPAQLHRAMGFRDLLLFYLVTFTVRWIGNAAAAGPSAVVIWIGAAVLFYLCPSSATSSPISSCSPP